MRDSSKKKFNFNNITSQAVEQMENQEKVDKTNIHKIKQKLVIREELKYLIPPLAVDERTKLSESIQAEGCRDALMVWHDQSAGEYVLIDGHNRYDICKLYKVDFEINIIKFDTKEDAIFWIVNNQLGKRNASDTVKAYLRGMQYNNEKQKESNVQNLKYQKEKITESQEMLPNKPENEHLEHITLDDVLDKSAHTADRLADLHRVSPKTIMRDEKFALGVIKLCGEDTLMKWDILSDNLKTSKKSLMNILSQEDHLIKAFYELIKPRDITFEKAYNQIFVDSQDTEKTAVSKTKKYKNTQIKEMQKTFNKSFSIILKTKDKQHIAQLRTYLDELENLL